MIPRWEGVGLPAWWKGLGRGLWSGGQRYASRVALSLGDQILTVGAPFVVNVELARVLPRSDYGIFTVVFTVLVFYKAVHGALVSETCFIYGSGRYRADFEDYRALGFWLTVGLAVMMALVTLSFYWALRLFSVVWASPLLLALAVAVSFVCLAAYFRQFCYVTGEFRLALGMSAGYAAVLVLGLFTLLTGGRLTGVTALLLLGLGWAPALALMVFRWRPGWGRSLLFLRRHCDYAGRHWEYARWLLATAVVFQFLTYAYYWLAAALLSSTAVADLRACGNLLRPADQVFIALDLLVLPRLSASFSARRFAAYFGTLRRFTLAIALLGAAFSGGVVLAGRLVLHWLYGGRYDDTAVLLLPMLAASMVIAVGNTYNAGLRAAERPAVVFWAYLGSAMVTLGAGIPLILRWQLRGAACGMVLSALAYASVMYLGFRTQVVGRFLPHEQEMVSAP